MEPKGGQKGGERSEDQRRNVKHRWEKRRDGGSYSRKYLSLRTGRINPARRASDFLPGATERMEPRSQGTVGGLPHLESDQIIRGPSDNNNDQSNLAVAGILFLIPRYNWPGAGFPQPGLVGVAVPPNAVLRLRVVSNYIATLQKSTILHDEMSCSLVNVTFLISVVLY